MISQHTLKAQIALVQHHIVLKKGIPLDLKVLKSYNISVAAEGMHRLRFLSKSPDGQLFATDMHSLADNKAGKIYLFEDWDSATKAFKTTTVFADGLHNPNQVMFYNDKGINYIYIAETDKLSRYIYHNGDKGLKGNGQVLARFPDRGLSYKYGGWHLTRSLAQHNGKIYVSVGSSCNACVEKKEDVRAMVLEMNPDGTGQKVYASGIRNAVAIKWAGNKLWGTCMGRDLLGADKPEDLFGTIEQGKNYGWPWYFQYQQKIYPDVAMMDSAKYQHIKVPAAPPLAYCGFKAHSAPLGFDQFTNFNDPLLKGNFLVALHGSTTVKRQRGNAVVLVAGKDKYVDIVSGFLVGTADKDRLGRPCDVMMNDVNSFYITDDKNGVLYYVWK
ncbi:PQQ-dependent sugar dehydrogenase [Mucilaginibacter sp. HMF5004]|uniref:PQQ-dependent sugar dehydrogenase n=1 Tax=Mucilaginibacter rivuli TaxID=2857527 RepID=UPI001C600005|nr:PQQ-dependent sugar dehydrogenase [Mucilaginibacter rivuli]MBW4888298.1 PQQ-dependent sugar dehydrogenase [Mucilaginibacter rivuli]